MRNHWLDSAEDVQWLRDTHLRNIELPAEFQNFKSAIIQGNEDCPHAVNLYNSVAATLSDDFCRIDFTQDRPTVAIYSGVTNKVRE